MTTLTAVALFFAAVFLMAAILMVSLEYLTNTRGKFTNRVVAATWWTLTAVTGVGAIATCWYGLVLMKRLVY